MSTLQSLSPLPHPLLVCHWCSSGDGGSLHCVAKHPSQNHVIACGDSNGVLSVWDMRQERYPVTLMEAHQDSSKYIGFWAYKAIIRTLALFCKVVIPCSGGRTNHCCYRRVLFPSLSIVWFICTNFLTAEVRSSSLSSSLFGFTFATCKQLTLVLYLRILITSKYMRCSLYWLVKTLTSKILFTRCCFPYHDVSIHSESDVLAVTLWYFAPRFFFFSSFLCSLRCMLPCVKAEPHSHVLTRWLGISLGWLDAPLHAAWPWWCYAQLAHR